MWAGAAPEAGGTEPTPPDRTGIGGSMSSGWPSCSGAVWPPCRWVVKYGNGTELGWPISPFVTASWVSGGGVVVTSGPMVRVDWSCCCETTRIVGPGYWLL